MHPTVVKIKHCQFVSYIARLLAFGGDRKKRSLGLECLVHLVNLGKKTLTVLIVVLNYIWGSENKSTQENNT